MPGGSAADYRVAVSGNGVAAMEGRDAGD